MANDTGILLNGDIPYSPVVAFDFQTLGKDSEGNPVILNNLVLDYAELIWNFYFAFFFGLLGSSLERFSLFIYSCALWGFYSIWTEMRSNPVFLDPVIFEQLMRCLMAAVMSAFVNKIFQMEQVLPLWAVVTIGTSYAIGILDEHLRKSAGCDSTVGPPTPHFQQGTWKNCDDWHLAYGITWTYSFLAYIVVLIAFFFNCLISKNKCTLFAANSLAVAMTASSAAVQALRSFVRISIENKTKPFNDARILNYADYVFWGILAVSFLAQYIVRRIMSSEKFDCFGICKAIACLAYPMFLIENALHWIEQKALEMNMDKSGKEEEEEENVKSAIQMVVTN